MSDAALFFEEIDGDRRRILLRGSTAPFGGPRRDAAFELGGTLRGPKTFSPGARAPVRHVTGAEERDLVIRGHLRDGLIGIDGDAARIRENIESIWRAARPLRIVWHKVLRRGLLTDARFGVESARDFTYELTFEIHDHGDRPPRFRTGSRPLGAFGLGSMLEDLTAARAALVAVPGLSLDVGGFLTDLFGALLNPLGQMLGFLEDIEAGVEDIESAFRGAVNAASTLLSRFEHLAGYLDAQADPIERDDAAARAAWARQRSEVMLQLQQAAAQAARLGAEAERRIQGSGSGRIHVVAAGETIESIAAREGVSVESIRGLNPDAGLHPPAGTRLRLP